MPRRKFIDKKNAATFALVYRPQSDPLIHDQDASDMVFKAVDAPNAKASSSQTHKIRTRGDLEDEFGVNIRSNEGEAANHGIFYDDTEYDYMQHLRDLGSSQEAYFVEAPSASQSQRKAKGKQKARLEDALREMNIAEPSERGSVASERTVEDEMLDDGNEFVYKRRTYQDQQDVPDAIGGFQPDMDPRLREALEALEDEEYVDDDEDIFAELAGDGEEVDAREFDDIHWEDNAFADADEDDGWETDDTIKAKTKHAVKPSASPPSDSDDGGVALPPSDPSAAPPDDEDGDWMAEFRKFKTEQKPHVKFAGPAPPSAQTGASSLLTGGRKKKRKGALTNGSAFSMTSASLARTDGLRTLDARFDKILEREYGEQEFDDEGSLASGLTGMSGMSAASGMSRASAASRLSRMSTTSSQAPLLMTTELEDALDGFLGSYEKKGSRVRRNKPQSGMAQLDEIRGGLGPARLGKKTQAT